MSVNVEAERKVAQLSEEIQGLARGVRSRDQALQEAGVKIELMERRMDTVKKQADAITNLETEIAKARKQERSYEEAIEQLQSDLDALEQDNAKLKQLTAGMERQRGYIHFRSLTYLTACYSSICGASATRDRHNCSRK